MISRRSILLLLAGLAIMLATVVCGGGTAPSGAPAPMETSQPVAGEPQATQAAAATSVPTILAPTATAVKPEVAPAIPETRRVTLEFPARIKVGDSDVIRLTIEVNGLGGITPTAQVQGNTVTGQTVQIPNLYDTHTVIAEARLDLAGLEIRPGDVISEPLLPGESTTFYWSVRPDSPGTFRGTAWLFLRFIDKATGQETRKAISAQTVTVEGTSLLGLNGNVARTAGGVGSIVGAVLGFPFVDELLKWLWRRLRGVG